MHRNVIIHISEEIQKRIYVYVIIRHLERIAQQHLTLNFLNREPITKITKRIRYTHRNKIYFRRNPNVSPWFSPENKKRQLLFRIERNIAIRYKIGSASFRDNYRVFIDHYETKLTIIEKARPVSRECK